MSSPICAMPEAGTTRPAVRDLLSELRYFPLSISHVMKLKLFLADFRWAPCARLIRLG